jgi:hypothetical protein
MTAIGMDTDGLSHGLNPLILLVRKRDPVSPEEKEDGITMS